MSSYRGRPSKGCDSCRSRKVKCDETKPICVRCTKSGHECRYRDHADLLFRNQTVQAAQKAEDSWRKRSKLHQRKGSDNTTPTSTSPPKTQKPISSSERHASIATRPDVESFVDFSSFNKLFLAPTIQPDIRRLAYERLIYDFVVVESPSNPPGEVSDALWDFIPHLYEQARPGSCVSTIIEAVSYVNFASRCHAPQAIALSEESISKGIKLLQATIADKDMSLTDEALCSVFMMGLYENLALARWAGTYAAHSNGASALLQLRTVEQFCTNPISTRLYETLSYTMLISNLQNATLPPLPAKNISATRKNDPQSYSSSGVHVIQLIHGLAKMHSKWHEIKHSSLPPTGRLELYGLLQTALHLDTEFQAWEGTIPRTGRYQMESNTLDARSTYEARWRNFLLESRGAPDEIHSYPSIRRCWTWMFYRTCRMIILRDQLEILNWMFKLQPPTQEELAVYQQKNATPEKPAPIIPDNVGLQIHHSFATMHLTNIVEKSSSAVLGTFTVPMYGKTDHDICGMRGYTVLWSLGVMDAVLKSGLIPDSGAPASPPNSASASSFQHRRTSSGGISSFGQLMNGIPAPSPAMFRMPPQNMHSLYRQGPLNGPQLNEFPKLPPLQTQTQTQMSPHSTCNSQSPIHTHTSPQASSSKSRSPSPFPSAHKTKRHIFDSSPHHPFDSPTTLPTLDFSTPTPKPIDIAARREWINRVLCYLGIELGIKKALVVPITEGYLDTCRAQMETLFAA
ncbi:hypothetical protein P280DRAFT_505883 [Massarina eburnea CBS 473.64]|uniref:Zn(2)-C6 fungal-type domain-containing protein n=1 Tax=Massarina eburnea CBS 473.64 TaxID=1395130 RepID=A0A6A6S5M1_9PLEO|nr:hypothetical protein P280DRAFT_505883 [Massarina eburnea CBS 473.64]